MEDNEWLIAKIRNLEARITELERAQRRPDRGLALPRSTQLPKTWQPSASDLQWARESYPHVDETSEREKFRAYYGSRGTILQDWDAGYRNWIYKAEQFRQRDERRSVARTASLDQTNRERLDRALDQLAPLRRDPPRS